jgi:hypothetical protein
MIATADGKRAPVKRRKLEWLSLAGRGFGKPANGCTEHALLYYHIRQDKPFRDALLLANPAWTYGPKPKSPKIPKEQKIPPVAFDMYWKLIMGERAAPNSSLTYKRFYDLTTLTRNGYNAAFTLWAQRVAPERFKEKIDEKDNV